MRPRDRVRRLGSALGTSMFLFVVLASDAAASPADLRAAIARFEASEAGRGLAFSAMFTPVDAAAVDSAVVTSHPDLPLVPASVAKLVTTTAALDRLGPDFTFSTQLWADGLLRDGVLHGNLVVRGGGDPFLVTERLWLLARAVRDLGLREVTGRLWIDDSAFAPAERDTARATREASQRPYAAGLTPLAVNFNSITVRLEPGEVAGAPGDATLEPLPCGYLSLVNQLRTAAAHTRPTWHVALAETKLIGATARAIPEFRAELSAELAALDSTSAPLGAPSIEAAPPPASRSYSDSLPIGERVVVEGRLALDSDPEYEYLSVAHPEFYSASMLRAFLEEAGVHVRGGTAFHLVPKQARLLLDFPSLPLSDLVGSMNRHSNNLMADLLAMKLSSASDASWPSSAVEPPASLSAGSRALTRWMQEELGAGPDLAMRDGSGLSPRTRLSGALLSKLLVGGWNDLRIQPALVASLPAPGEDGTLRRRWKSIEPRPPVRAKTGTLGDARASAMAGYLVDPRRGTVAFVLLMNGRTAAWGIPAMQALQEKWVLTYLQ